MATKSTANPPNTQRPDEQGEAAITRRGFMSIAWAAAGALVLGESALVGYRFFEPKVSDGEFGGVFDVGSVEDFPPGSVTPFSAGRFYLIRQEDGGFLALYRKCTHLGCAVPWEPAAGAFICSCHASQFESNGEVINPPAPRPLDRFPVAIEGGIVRVDTGETIQRDRTAPTDAVYA